MPSTRRRMASVFSPRSDIRPGSYNAASKNCLSDKCSGRELPGRFYFTLVLSVGH